MRFPAFLNPLRWFSGPGKPASASGTGWAPASSARPAHRSGVPMGSVKALPGQLASRIFSSENRRRQGQGFIQGELTLPEVQPVRSDLFEDDVELVRRRKETRLIHETRPEPSTPGRIDPELAINRLRRRGSQEIRTVHLE